MLAFELRKRGFEVEEEWPIPVKWNSIQLDIGFRADLVVNRVVLVELKSLENIAAVHKKVLLTYLRISDKQVGLLINFGEEVLKSGIHRVVNNYEENADRNAGGEQVCRRSKSSAASAPLREMSLE